MLTGESAAMQRLEIQLHPEKTRFVNLRHGKEGKIIIDLRMLGNS